MIKIAHIVNPIQPSNENASYFCKAQTISLESIKNAQLYDVSGNAIDAFLVEFIDEPSINYSPFVNLQNLENSTLDLKISGPLKKKLPYIADILSVVNRYEEKYDYYIYSNIDIALLPHFYSTIDSYLREGYDSIAINRRTISDSYDSIDELPLMYADIGKSHEGIDCFVISEKILRRANFISAFIGSGPVGLCFVANMITFGNKFIWLEREHLTFHLGDDKSWKNPAFVEYEIENFVQLDLICQFLIKHCNANQKPKAKEVLEEIKFHAMNNIIALRGGKRHQYGKRFPKSLLSKFSDKSKSFVEKPRMTDRIKLSLLRYIKKAIN